MRDCIQVHHYDRAIYRVENRYFDLKFNCDLYYILRDSIVETLKFNNRTIYSKFERIDEPPSTLLIAQHLNGELKVALPLIQDGRVNYILLEYQKEEGNRFYYLLKHTLKSLYIEEFYTYLSAKNGYIQIFIPVENIPLESAYELVERIDRELETKFSKRCKIIPNRNLPPEYSLALLPIDNYNH